ncbi:helix-turn-helix domain-containing protein [Methanothermococcus okinawensis]|uniref:Transcriptional regulator, XRE family n=1 Tax=Methanothermococcus okinawensis (strain DSM 14208 / JCM 11175 / IH1) TaxID=647113 RepID=F8AK75_METOI|nr:helix-turn-helix domain-containing protein [Methanothermococcus okinawensis]AEH07444.1 transcriptional regulator, XRE family [Methanothermococcus okinawensis IH1]
MEKIKVHIIGDIVLSDDIGKSMKKWREMFNIPQIDVSRYLGLSPSVVSDYETGRRKNPGVNIVKRYVDALVELDKENGGHTIRALQKVLNPPSMKAILQIREYTSPISIKEFLNVIEGELVCCGNRKSNDKELEGILNNQIFGHTVVDSIKAILEMDGQDFLNLYGWTTERALIFTNVSSGRSPMVAIRVSSIKPRLVVLQGVSKLDKLALKIAEIEGIPLIITKLDINELLKRLKGILN